MRISKLWTETYCFLIISNCCFQLTFSLEDACGGRVRVESRESVTREVTPGNSEVRTDSDCFKITFLCGFKITSGLIDIQT